MKLKTTFCIGGSILLMAGLARADFGMPITAPEALNNNAPLISGTDSSPQVSTDGDGNWVAVWSSDDTLDSTIGTDVDILVSRSTDNGATWTDAAALNDYADSGSEYDYRPQVTTDGAGTWLAVWYSNTTLGGTIGTDEDILVSVSTDNGATWTNAAALNNSADTDSRLDSYPQVTTDGAGTWLAVWHSDDDLGGTIGTDTDVLVAVSTDDGDTWTDPAAVNSYAASDSSTDREPQVATDGAGNWVAVWHTNETLSGTIGTDLDILVSLSTDDGDTWTTAEALNSNAATDNIKDASPQVATDDAGNWVAVWGSFDTLGGTIGSDADILVSLSTDDGDTWTNAEALNSNAGSDTGSDSMAQIATDGDGNWVAVWKSDDTLGGTIGTDRDILVARSDDDGDTWTTVQAFNTNADSDLGTDWGPQITADGASNWVGVWWSTDSLGSTIFSDQDILFARFQICYVNGECDDENDCTADTCVDNACTYTDEDSGTTCDDGLYCTNTDECDGSGTCVGTGTPCTGQASKCCECPETETCIRPIYQCACPQ